MRNEVGITMTKLVYLCGPIAGLTYSQARFGWRKTVSETLSYDGIQCLSPMRFKDSFSGEEVMNTVGYEMDSLTTAKGLTTRDRFDTQRCDLMICNVLGADRISIGSMIELGWADSVRTPIILVMDPVGNVHDHAMVRELAGFIVSSVDEAIYAAIKILKPGI